MTARPLLLLLLLPASLQVRDRQRERKGDGASRACQLHHQGVNSSRAALWQPTWHPSPPDMGPESRREGLDRLT